jgi:benzylsuccinate CoA-transferase BbsE subunit
VYMMAGGIGANRFWGRTIEWFEEEGVQGLERLRGDQWNETAYLQSEQAKQIFLDVFGAWAKTQNKNDLYRRGQERQVPVAAINDVSDLLESQQLASRGYFVPLKQESWRAPAQVPGAPYQFSATPWMIGSAAPLPGQHNAEILGQIAPVGRAAGGPGTSGISGVSNTGMAKGAV